MPTEEVHPVAGETNLRGHGGEARNHFFWRSSMATIVTCERELQRVGGPAKKTDPPAEGLGLVVAAFCGRPQKPSRSDEWYTSKMDHAIIADSL